MSSRGICPLWGGGKELEFIADARRIDNPRAGGAYEITGSALAMLESHRTDTLAAKLTTWVIDQHRSGVDRPTITSDIIKTIAERPRLNISAQIERFFLMLAHLDARADFELNFGGVRDEAYKTDRALIASWLECETEQELSGLVSLLIQSDYLTGKGYVGLTPNGVERLTQIQRGERSSQQAFVAMWFDPSMGDAWKDGFDPGIRAAGYKPMRIDQKEHNNKVDDEIVAEIRRSKFVVADFTSDSIEINGNKSAISRGGVYFEAGYALGLGLPVIWCCRSDLIDLVHFDTRQFAHVVWNTPEDLAKKLYARISAVIGETSDAPGMIT